MPNALLLQALKVLVSAVIITAASELAKRSELWAGILISLPLVSILALTWVYFETHDLNKLNLLSKNIAMGILPSILFFVIFSGMLSFGFRFFASIFSASIFMILGYAIFAVVLSRNA